MKLYYNEEVKEALAKNKPIVALESTIISHGMPYPDNIKCAKELENILRDNGVTPATIAIINGEIHVGITESELNLIGDPKTEVLKVSKRDLPICVARGVCGATTVSATMYISKLAGIKIFATGGIGGVHRGYSEVLDISNDLETLGSDEVVVVCAGCKSILDIPNTLEYLETKGVPVLGYKTIECPAFYSNKSGINLEYRVDSPKEIASIALNKWDLGLKGGVLVFNPISDEFSYDSDEINKVIDEALLKAKKENITGKRITPFLLSNIAKATEGKSLKSNIELVKSNVKLAALIAKEM